MANQQTGDGNSADTIKVGVNGQSVSVASGTGAKFGMFGATPVAQATPAGDVTVVTAGATNTVYRNTTFTGNTGSTEYTIGDLVKILKGLGIIKT